jgi:hypothetical protein
VPALLTTLVLSTAELVASVDPNGTKSAHGKDQKEASLIFWSIEKNIPSSLYFLNTALMFGQHFLKANCNLWKVLNWILWHFHPDFYEKYNTIPKFSEQ